MRFAREELLFLRPVGSLAGFGHEGQGGRGMRERGGMKGRTVHSPIDFVEVYPLRLKKLN